jgi:hypothetical protein
MVAKCLQDIGITERDFPSNYSISSEKSKKDLKNKN